MVLIKVIAAGVNGLTSCNDAAISASKGASDLLGLEVSGEIVDVGCDQPNGQLVTGYARTNGGGYAEYVAVNARHCLPIPTASTNKMQQDCRRPILPFGAISFLNKNKRRSVFLVHGGLAALGPQQSKLARPWAYKSLQRQVSSTPVPIVRILGRSVRSISMKRILFQSCVKLVEQILF